MFRGVADRLRKAGYVVEESESSPVGAHSTGSAAQDALNKVDMAFLVIRGVDGKDVGGPVRPFQRIIREAGVIQGKLGMDRVLLLVDESVRGLSADTGLGVIRYPAENPDSAYDDIEAIIKLAFPPQPRDLHAADPIREQAREDALRVPWVLVAVIVLAAIVPMTLAFSRLIRSGSDGEDDQARVAEDEGEGSIGDGLLDPGGTERLSGVSGALSRSSVAAGAAGGTFGGGDLDQPAAPEVSISAGNALLPATCRIDVDKDLALAEAIECEGTGTVLVEGETGPWHNDIRWIAVSEGVVGEAAMEPRSNGATVGPAVVALAPGEIPLNEADAQFGVSSITLTFTGHNQHIHLRQDQGRGAVATLVFSLDQ